MLLERIVYSILCAVLLVYTSCKYFKTHSNLFLALAGLQIVATVIQLLSLFTNTYMDIFVQIYIVLFGIFIPIFLFFTEYFGVDLNEKIDIKTGDMLAKKGEYEKAITKYRKALERNDKNASTYAKMGKVYNALGDRRTAFDKFAKAIELDRSA